MADDIIDRKFLVKLENIIKEIQGAAPDVAALEVRPNKKSLTNAKATLRRTMNLISDFSVELSNLVPKD